MAKRGLGRGLEALLPPKEVDPENHAAITRIAIDRIVAGRHQPRKDFDNAKLEELAQSIKVHGVIQPIVVKPAGSGKYEIIAGERRWRACRQAGLKEIPAIIKTLDDRATAEISLIENLQREDLNPLEEAEAYEALITEHHLTQEEIAGRVGKSRPVIANALRLLQLPAEIQKMLRSNEISSGHARALLALKDAEHQVALAKKIKEENLSVRETEAIIKKIQSEGELARKKQNPGKRESLEVRQVEERLQQVLSTRVKLKHGKKSGKIEIFYFGPEDLERIIMVLTGENVSRETF
ncbi:Stage 0 sporulation protein J [Moorella thermoacetica]|uniref:ParB/RepB/Spo0J family partition protein n=1 Tax=Neomoorella thermoacetica TaxID=1525 RepID=UPI0030D2A91E